MLRLGTVQAVDTMPAPSRPSRKKRAKRLSSGGHSDDEEVAPAKLKTAAPPKVSTGDPEVVGEGRTKDGKKIYFSSALARSAFFCRYGWLVNDVVGREQATMANHAQSRYLIANALYALQLAGMAAVIAAWASSTTSSVQLGITLGIKAVWLQYVLAFRPFASVVVLIIEVLPSVLELLVFIFALLQVKPASLTSARLARLPHP